MSTHTPGPWRKIIAQPGTIIKIVNDRGEYVCSLLGGDEFQAARAALIEQAPAMFETIADVLEWMETGMVDGVYYDEASIRAQLRAQIDLVIP